jgi:hypothetical protein
MIFGMIIKAENHGPDLLVWVELRVPEIRPELVPRVVPRHPGPGSQIRYGK